MELNSQDGVGSLKSADASSTSEGGPAVASTPLTSGAHPSMGTVTVGAGPPRDMPTSLSAGSHAGRYRLDRCLGRGSFGEVWKGYDPVLDVVVAIKVPRSDRAYSPADSDLFVEEARKQARLNHPAIVKVRHAEREASSWLIVTDFIDGTSLAAHLANRKFSPAESARLVADIADALDSAHRQRLIHRDVKPANILLDEAGRPFLTDFGLALSEDEQQAERDIVAGTYAYMSPEQIRGDTHFLDGRSDIFSLGVVLYEMLTGERPFRGVVFQEYREQILSRHPKPPRAINDAIPRELERICLKCLAKSVEERYATAADLASDLRRSGQPKSSRLMKAAIGVGVVGVAVALVLAVVQPWAAAPLPRFEPEPVPKPAPVIAPGPIALWKNPKKLIWPIQPENTLLEVKNDEELIWVVCDRAGIFKLGDVTEPDYTFRMNVNVITPQAMCGVLLGWNYFAKDGKEWAHFEMIRLSPNILQPTYTLSHFTVNYDMGFGGTPMGHALAHAKLNDLPPRDCTLEIKVVGDRLASVRWDGRELPELTPAAPPPLRPLPLTLQGGICIFVRDGTFRFHRPEIEVRKPK